jgi:hypothetical protein
MNDFDKSSQLEPRYEIDDEENEPGLENLKVEFDNKIVNIDKKLNNMMVIK